MDTATKTPDPPGGKRTPPCVKRTPESYREATLTESIGSSKRHIQVLPQGPSPEKIKVTFCFLSTCCHRLLTDPTSMCSQLRLLRCGQGSHGPGGASGRLSKKKKKKNSSFHDQCDCSCFGPHYSFSLLERKTPLEAQETPIWPRSPSAGPSSHPRASPQEAHKAGSCHSFMSTLGSPLCFLGEKHLLGLAPPQSPGLPLPTRAHSLSNHTSKASQAEGTLQVSSRAR